ncbi:PfaD family polyunsaturated fatty acid/polyketide biosynthesis protein [Amycolatopsis sp. EV170708-02-1]|uniref:PfaD family polyunsaturated fatty acid/polyketide biosynthesis protein n=1 Tax=Amycolatopsis sp. EV170708-02-1 TaxID=2919322 RepID=UPI001F0BE2BB|nr:PfaD family polyunsaturated fatty acid/polyketide biosynthesis protein [Amycolatopsis sp. EV170708-02-1]UMP06725.1 PfaD family polyunsaturated fatty acid/polyketide biosynthesis protein [Amycolatopsis sp. EV170708-02-1]
MIGTVNGPSAAALPNSSFFSSIGTWEPGDQPPAFGSAALTLALGRVREPVHVLADRVNSRIGVGFGGVVSGVDASGYGLLGTLPPLYPEWLGDRSFGEAHGVRFPYVAGEMANGIATSRLVIAMARAEMLAFFGAAGLALSRVEQAVNELSAALGDRPNWGVNLIHSPAEPALETKVADLLIRSGVPHVSASAFMRLTPAVVRCAVAGLRVDEAGRVVRARHLFAKVSRAEVAGQFMSPAPAELLRALVERGELTEEEERLACRVPVAEDVTVEADSGGHTDNRPLVSLLPVILAQRDQLSLRYGYARPIRVGAGGGLGTPAGVAAAFGLGAAYVVTGSVNQATTEAGISDDAKAMLARAGVADTVMAPAADMFEMGVKLQVLQQGTMFASRAARLYELYRTYESLEDIPAALRDKLERQVLRLPLADVWAQTAAFWADRDPGELARAQREPKHRMALVFRWYLGKSSRWAIDGDVDRRTDYQIWCGPAMGAFNGWVAGSFLAEPAARSVVQIARNLLEGATVLSRAQQLRTYGVALPPESFRFTPRRLS